MPNVRLGQGPGALQGGTIQQKEFQPQMDTDEKRDFPTVRKAHRLARIFHSHFGKSREKPYEKRVANTFECVVEKTRHAGLETCDTAHIH